MDDNKLLDPFAQVVDHILDRLLQKADSYQMEEITLVKNILDAIEDALRSDRPSMESYAMISILKIDMKTDLIFHYWEKSGGRDSKHFDFISSQHTFFFNKDPAPFYPGNFQIPDNPFLDTNYSKALLSLESIHGKYPETQDHWGTDKLSPKRRAVLVFFAVHPDLDPVDTSTLTSLHFNEIRQLFDKIDSLLSKASAPGKEYDIFLPFFLDYFGNASKTDFQLIPRITAALVKSIEYPLDKPDKQIWKSLTADQLQEMTFGTERAGSPKEADVVVGINFDELEETAAVVKHLTPFDKRVYIAVAALYNSGNEVFSSSQIYNAMGNTSRPSPARLEKINDSLTKMGGARLRLDNSKEVTVNKGYPLFRYDAPLLPFERLSAYINGRLCKSAIRLYREPPLVSFAKQRRQVTTLSSQIFEVPLNHTDSELELENFLIDNISHIKNGSRNPKILLSFLYADCQIDAKKERARTKDKLKVILDHYKKVGFIEGYSFDSRAGEILIQAGTQKRSQEVKKRSKQRET